MRRLSSAGQSACFTRRRSAVRARQSPPHIFIRTKFIFARIIFFPKSAFSFTMTAIQLYSGCPVVFYLLSRFLRATLPFSRSETMNFP